MPSDENILIGFQSRNTYEFVPKQDAYTYALEHCLAGEKWEQREFEKMLVEWYFSGDWNEVHEQRLLQRRAYESAEGIM